MSEPYEQVQNLEQELLSAKNGFRLFGEPDDLEEFHAYYEDDPASQQRVIKRARDAVAALPTVHAALAGVAERERWLRPLVKRTEELLTTLSVADPKFDASAVREVLQAVAALPAASSATAIDPAAPAAVKKQLAFLARTKHDKELLALVASKATGVSKKRGLVELAFSRTRVELAGPCKPARGVPASYGAIAEVHRSIRWRSEGWFGFTGLDEKGKFAEGSWEADALEEGDNEALLAALKKAKKKPGDVHCAFSCGQNWILFDPTRTTSRGEPGWAFVSHADCQWVPLALDALDAGQVLLRLMAWQLAGERGLLSDVHA